MKRSISFLIAVTILATCLVGIASAASGQNGPMASRTISSKYTYASTGSNTGEVDFEYSVTPTGYASTVGVSSIVVHKPDGSTHTITGTFANGMLTSGVGCGGTYTYTGISGQYYYAEITFTATVGSATDSKTVTTSSARAR